MVEAIDELMHACHMQQQRLVDNFVKTFTHARPPHHYAAVITVTKILPFVIKAFRGQYCKRPLICSYNTINEPVMTVSRSMYKTRFVFS